MELTKRQLEILRHLWDGHTHKTAARRLDLSEKTVCFHVTNLFDLFGVSDRVSLVRRALEQGIFTVTKEEPHVVSQDALHQKRRRPSRSKQLHRAIRTDAPRRGRARRDHRGRSLSAGGDGVGNG